MATLERPTAAGEPDRAAPGPARRIIAALDERLGIDSLRYPVPEHANNLGWSLGGLTAASFVILLVTGVYLAQFYNPMPEAANQSIRDTSTDVWLGAAVRGVHFWAAQAMYVLVILHLLRVIFHGSYKRPREGNYLVGVTMLALIIAALFTGTVLKWDQEGFEALGHNTEIARLLGGLGYWLTPEAAANLPILVRLYTAHIVVIPGLIVVLLILHALLIKRHGISPHPAIGATAHELAEPFTHHLRRVTAFGLVLLGGLAVLAVVAPPAVGPTPVEGVEVTRPPWMFWWLYTLENWFGLTAIVWGSVVLFALLVLPPFLDRGPERSWRGRPITITVTVLAVAAMVVLTLLVFFIRPEEHL